MTDTDARENEHVYIARASTRDAYHTDPNCHHGPTEHVRRVDRETATEKMDLRECRFCAGETTHRGRNQYDVFPELHAED